MKQVQAIAAVAILGLVAAIPAAAKDGTGTHGVTATTTHGSPNRGSGTGTTTPRGNSGSDHGRPDGDRVRHDGDHARTDGDHDREHDRDHDRRTGPTTGTATTTNTALAAKLSRNPEQLARIKAMLPAGVTLDQATAGFRNQGQFIAALNASKNQGVSFVDLQKAMTVDGLSLGQAVRKLKTPSTTTTTTPTPTTTTTSAS